MPKDKLTKELKRRRTAKSAKQQLTKVVAELKKSGKGVDCLVKLLEKGRTDVLFFAVS